MPREKLAASKVSAENSETREKCRFHSLEFIVFGGTSLCQSQSLPLFPGALWKQEMSLAG